MRCFSSPGWLGYSRIKARLTAPPDLSQSSTPFRLLAPRHPPHALTSLAAPPYTPHACCQAREGSGGTSSLPWPEPPGHYRMISPSKARVTFRQASHSTARTRSGHGFRYAPCSPQPHSTRPSIRCYSHTHVVKDQQANMPHSTSAPFNQVFLVEGIPRSTRHAFVRLVYWSAA